MTRLPIDTILPTLCDALEHHTNVVLQAPPGAGKTTRVPLALLDAAWRKGGKIIMLEPRRLAARAAARRMASTLDEAIGNTVGYRVQLDNKTGANTVIEVVTEGILTRRLQRDPSLQGVAAVIFDEFHERNLQADLGLALCLDCQAGLREDLRLLVMSATLEGAPVAALLGDAPIISSEGRSFPVETHYLGKPPASRFKDTFCPAMASAIRRAIRNETGSVLAFLPGEGEIRRVESLLKEAPLPDNVCVLPLYGSLSQKLQDRAIAPTTGGKRKIVLATAIAETSLTIEAVRVVIDGGLSREPRFDPQSGMTRLVTEPVSLAAATQRQGRAGRLGPGACYRLWEKAGEGALRTFRQPEILHADLAPLALDLANWGTSDPAALSWLTPPPDAPLAQARALLRMLGALDKQGRITGHGRAMADLAMHPRLAHMVIRGGQMGWADRACQVAALLSERDVARRDGRTHVPVDISLRLAALRGSETSLQIEAGALKRARTLAKHWLKKAPKEADQDSDLGVGAEDQTGALVALAYPDRIAKRRAGGEPRYRQTNGKGSALPKEDPLHEAPFLAISSVTDDQRDARIRAASALSLTTIEALFNDQTTLEETVVWDPQSQAVLARKQKRLFALVLSDAPAEHVPPEQIAKALLEGIRQTGLGCLPWTAQAREWRQRVRCLHQTTGNGPDLSDDTLLQTMDQWLLPFLPGKSRLAHLKSLDLLSILKSMVDWSTQQMLEKQVPSHLTVPSGSNVRIDYSDPAAPVLGVKLQEMFGAMETPKIADGRLALTLHLLSPAGRPLQITQDLAAFWQNAYPQVKAEMKGRYPKHPWPDDPVAAAATRHTKRRLGQNR